MSWQKVKLKEVLEQYRVQHIVQDDIEYKQVSILNDGSVVLRGSKIGKEIGRKRQFIIDLNNYPETLIFTRQLLLQGSIGIASDDVNNCIVTENMPMFSIQTSKIDKDFLILFLKSEVFKSRIRKIELSGSAQKSIHEKTFLDLEFHIPKIEEQKEIVVELLKLKSHSNSISIEIINQLNLIKQLRQAFLREAMQGKLVKNTNTKETGQQLLEKIKAEKAQLIAEKKLKKEKELPTITDDEIPFEIPEHWAWCRLGEILNIKSGKRIHASDYRNEGVPFLRSGEIGSLGRGEKIKTELFISQSKYDEVKTKFGIPKSGDILIACIGGSIGNTWLVDDREFYYKDGNLVLIETTSHINYNYLLSYLKSPFFWNNTILNATDSSYNALTIIKLNQSEFPLPPLHEQEQIVAKLQELMAFCDGLEQSIKESQGYNKMLLQQVLREALQPSEDA